MNHTVVHNRDHPENIQNTLIYIMHAKTTLEDKDELKKQYFSSAKHG